MSATGAAAPPVAYGERVHDTGSDDVMQMEPAPETADKKAPLGSKKCQARQAFEKNDIELSRKIHKAHLGHNADDDEEVSDYIKSIVFGGLDGIITTFAVIAAAQGASDELEMAKTALILGVANLFADGFSMGFGEYIGSRAEIDYATAERRREEWEVDNAIDMEREEMVDIYCGKGLQKDDATELVNIISKDKKIFVDIMMVEELGLLVDMDDAWKPLKSAMVMFTSFVVFGMVPLFVYIPQADGEAVFYLACAVTAVTLFCLGAVRGRLTRQSWWRCGIMMVMNGTVAAALSYLVGWLVSSVLGENA